MESRRRQTITITKANFETCERFLQFCLYINLLKPNSMQHDCLKYFRILINWFGKTYYYFSMIFKNMAIHHLVNCLFYANLRTSIWGWWVTGSGPYICTKLVILCDSKNFCITCCVACSCWQSIFVFIYQYSAKNI